MTESCLILEWQNLCLAFSEKCETQDNLYSHCSWNCKEQVMQVAIHAKCPNLKTNPTKYYIVTPQNKGGSVITYFYPCQCYSLHSFENLLSYLWEVTVTYGIIQMCNKNYPIQAQLTKQLKQKLLKPRCI